MIKKIAASVFLFVSVSSFASGEAEIRNFFVQTAAHLNSQDLDRIASAWTEKGELVSLAGGIYTGRDEVKAFFQEAFSGPYRQARFEFLIQYIRVKNGNRATVDGVWKVKGGPANYPSCGIFVYNLIKQKEAWGIEFANSSVVREGHTAEHGRTLSWVKACKE